jgi:hypothetical protein
MNRDDREVSGSESGVAADTAGVQIKTHHWLHWTHIAIEQEKRAQEARKKALQAGAGEAKLGTHLTNELKASMIAVAAAGHALDGIYGAVKPAVNAVENELVWNRNKTARRKRILETLKLGFEVSDGRARHWGAELAWLFDLRDAAVHPAEEFAQPVRHPVGTNVGAVYMTYNVEAVRRGIDLVVEIANHLVTHPRRGLEEVEKWAAHMRNSVDSFPKRGTLDG